MTPTPPLHLPSGRVVRLAGAAPEPLPAGAGGLLGALDRGQLWLEGEGGERTSVDTLPVEDFFVLQAFASARGVQEDPAWGRPCSNCGEPLGGALCASVAWAPFLNGDLTHPELDEDFPYDEPLPLRPEGHEEPLAVVLRPATVGEARGLLEAPERLRPTGAQVRALGVVALGEERHPGRIARALQGLDEEGWAAFLDTVERAWYHPRLEAWLSCEACGARNVAPAPPRPWRQEREGGEGPPFPGFEEFSARVEAHARRVFRARGGEGVGLFVEAGPADCDDGGVPLLGAYEPPIPEDHGIPGRPPEIKIYYRTFRAMHEEDGPYDLDEELRETLEHELEHHHAFLAGDDPVDDEERAEISRELRGRLGDVEVRRRSIGALRRGLGEFLYRTWPLWLIALGAALLEAWGARRG